MSDFPAGLAMRGRVPRPEIASADRPIYSLNQMTDAIAAVWRSMQPSPDTAAPILVNEFEIEALEIALDRANTDGASHLPSTAVLRGLIARCVVRPRDP